MTHSSSRRRPPSRRKVVNHLLPASLDHVTVESPQDLFEQLTVHIASHPPVSMPLLWDFYHRHRHSASLRSLNILLAYAYRSNNFKQARVILQELIESHRKGSLAPLKDQNVDPIEELREILFDSVWARGGNGDSQHYDQRLRDRNPREISGLSRSGLRPIMASQRPIKESSFFGSLYKAFRPVDVLKETNPHYLRTIFRETRRASTRATSLPLVPTATKLDLLRHSKSPMSVEMFLAYFEALLVDCSRPVQDLSKSADTAINDEPMETLPRIQEAVSMMLRLQSINDNGDKITITQDDLLQLLHMYMTPDRHFDTLQLVIDFEKALPAHLGPLKPTRRTLARALKGINRRFNRDKEARRLVTYFMDRWGNSVIGLQTWKLLAKIGLSKRCIECIRMAKQGMASHPFYIDHLKGRSKWTPPKHTQELLHNATSTSASKMRWQTDFVNQEIREWNALLPRMRAEQDRYEAKLASRSPKQDFLKQESMDQALPPNKDEQITTMIKPPVAALDPANVS